jgi:hypothetical protein
VTAQTQLDIVFNKFWVKLHGSTCATVVKKSGVVANVPQCLAFLNLVSKLFARLLKSILFDF